jgi:hypothetical protein
MDFFTSTFSHTQTTRLPTSFPLSKSDPYQTALSLIHNPSALISLNPLVTNFEELDPQDPDIPPILLTHPSTSQSPYAIGQNQAKKPLYFRITESKPLFWGLYTAHIVFHISYLRVPDGCDTVVAAAAGVSIDGTWRVQKMDSFLEGGEEEVSLVETASISCPSIFSWFIQGSLGESHEELHRRFVGMWREKLGRIEPNPA